MTCYFDDSVAGGGLVSVVAGYLAADQVWAEFIPRWRKVLDAAPHEISEYKTSDCRHGVGEFKGWSKEQRDVLTTELVSVILNSGDLGGFSTVLLWPGIPDPDVPNPSENRRRQEHGGYGVVLGMTLTDTLRTATLMCGPDGVQPIVDQKDGTLDRMQGNFKVAKRIVDTIDGPEIANRLKQPIPGDSKKLPPLQAADLLAYETGKEVMNRAEGRRVSKALERLVTGTATVIHIARVLDWGPGKDYMAALETNMRPYLTLGPFLYRSDWHVRSPGLWGIR